MKRKGKPKQVYQDLGKQFKKQALFIKKLDKRFRWLGAGLFCFALFPILSYFPEFTEQVFSQKIFKLVRALFDYTIGFINYPMAPILFVILLLWMGWKIFRFIRFNIRNKQVSTKNRVKYALLSIGSFLGKVSVWFFLTWGYHFWRVPVNEYMGFSAEPLGTNEIFREANIARKSAEEAREMIPGLNDQPFGYDQLPPREQLEKEMRQNLNKVMRYMNYPTYDNARCRIVEDNRWMRTLGYTGVYLSVFGEAYVDYNLSPVYLPFTVAHELVHAYGFFDEATANFFAYLACEQSDNPAIIYSGRISHLLYVTHELWFTRMNYPKPILHDLFSNGMFKSTGHYNAMILYVKGWREKYPIKLP